MNNVQYSCLILWGSNFHGLFSTTCINANAMLISDTDYNLMNLKGKLHQSRLVFSCALYNKHEQKYICNTTKIHTKHNTRNKHSRRYVQLA